MARRVALRRRLPRARRQGGFLLAVLLLLLVLASAVLWVVTTTSGANFALRLGLGATGMGEVSGVRGSLWRGLEIDELQVRTEALDVRAAGVTLRVDWPALTERRLSVLEAGVASLALDLRTVESAPEPETDPTQRPSWPELPGAIEVHSLRLGELAVTQDGEPVPLGVAGLDAALSAGVDGARLELRHVEVRGPDAEAVINGVANVAARDPLVVDVRLGADLRQADLAAELTLTAEGTVEDLAVTLVGSGQGIAVDATARLAPLSATLPVTALEARVRGFDPAAWVPDAPSALLNVTVGLHLDGVLLPPLAEPAAGPPPDGDPSVVAPEASGARPDAAGQPTAPGTTATDAQPMLDWGERLRDLRAALSLSIDEGSLWQGQPLRGKVDARLEGARLPAVTADLAVADNTLRLSGALGDANDQLDFSLAAPRPQLILPGVEGSATLEGSLRGMPEKHELSIAGRVDLPALTPVAASATPPARIETVAPGQNEVVDETQGEPIDLPGILRQGPVDLRVRVAGGWGPGVDGQLGPGRDGWRGTVAELDVRNRQAGLTLASPLALSVVPGEPLLWSAGQTSVRLQLPGQRSITLAHQASSGSGSQWRSAGAIDDLVPAWLVAQLPQTDDPLRVDVAWDLAMDNALSGTASIRRRGGDLAMPGSPPLAAGLSELAIQVRATPTQGGASTLALEASIAGSQIGTLQASGTTVVTVSDGVPELTEAAPINVDARLNIADIGIFGELVGDTTEIGGALAGDVRLTRQAGVWDTAGTVTGSDLRVVLIDDGIRLLDGSLQARLANGQVLVDSLRFPGVIRSAPRDSRIQTWLARNTEGSAVEAQGRWSLENASGQASVTLTRFPLVQRADRFIAGSGNVDIQASPSNFDITGKVVTDIGWISLEGASDLPSLSSDVVIVRAGDEVPEAGPALDMALDLQVDIGPAFYLTGMGLNTALEGSLRIRNTRAGLRAHGVVNTLDGRFGIYGQTLVVRRGAVTFQGLLDDPLLDIIAVRPNLRIEAGVQVSGTARNPIITLVSYPEVPEVEQLSWLLLGRGPDASGADAGMLLAAAASLLGDDDAEPLYRQLGLDEFGLRSGITGSLGGLLPERTVVGSLSSATESDADAQFLVIGKRLSNSLYLTFEQALSGRETVVRASYRINERLTAAAQGGTLNGLQLIWSLVFDD